MRCWVRYEWQKAYLHAILEKDRAEVSLKICQALSIFKQRRLTYLGDDEGKSLGEAEAELRTMLHDELLADAVHLVSIVST
jgi:hypothetical protein